MNSLEFIDPQLILTSLLLLLATFLLSANPKRKSSEKGYFIEWVLLILIIINIAAPLHEASCAQENKNEFSQGRSFTCKNSGNQYRVSIKDGWEVDKSYFVKESLMIRADMCEKE